jgi:hypothetical protein
MKNLLFVTTAEQLRGKRGNSPYLAGAILSSVERALAMLSASVGMMEISALWELGIWIGWPKKSMLF